MMLAYLFIWIQTISLALAGFLGSFEAGGHTFLYFAGDTQVDWVAAALTCPQLSRGMQLAMPKTEEINNAITQFLSMYGNPVTWLGGHDIVSEDYWTWVDGTPFYDTFNNWGPGQPSYKQPEDCLEINWEDQAAGKWNDRDCSTRFGYICQIDSMRVGSSFHSELTVHDEIPRTFWESRRECEKIGAKLVEIEDEESEEVILRKLKDARNTKYWVDMKNVGSGCSVLGQDGTEEHDCNEKRVGFICETVRPHMVTISDENPVVAESGGIQLDCTASGFPLPDVAWYRDNELMPNQSIGKARSTLTIKNATPEDAGSYACTARNIINGKESVTMAFAKLSVNPN